MTAGRILTKNGRYCCAVKLLKTYTDTYPKNGILWSTYGVALGKRAKNASVFSKPGLADRSFQAFKKAVSLRPDIIEHRYELMLYYAKAPGFMGGDVDKAYRQAVQAEKINTALGAGVMAEYYALQDQYDRAE